VALLGDEDELARGVDDALLAAAEDIDEASTW
jgi:hypothetical protein